MIYAERSKSVPIGQIHPQNILPNRTVTITMMIEARKAVTKIVPVRTITSVMSGSILKKKLVIRFFCNGKETFMKRKTKKIRKNP